MTAAKAPGVDLVALDEAMNALAAMDPRKSHGVELDFLGGLNVEETAEVMKISSDIVLRDWKMAKSWLRCEMSGKRWDGA